MRPSPCTDIVPFRVSGPGADQTLEHRLFQIGGHTVAIRQDPTVGVVLDLSQVHSF